MQFILVKLTTIILQKSIKNVNNKNYSFVKNEGFNISMVIIARYKKKIKIFITWILFVCAFKLRVEPIALNETNHVEALDGKTKKNYKCNE